MPADPSLQLMCGPRAAPTLPLQDFRKVNPESSHGWRHCQKRGCRVAEPLLHQAGSSSPLATSQQHHRSLVSRKTRLLRLKKHFPLEVFFFPCSLNLFWRKESDQFVHPLCLQ